MNEQTVRPASVAAAAVLIGGVLIVVVPQHAASTVRLVIVTGAAATALYALALHAAPAWWTSPLDRRPRRILHRTSHDVDAIRAGLAGRRQRIAHGPPLPPETLRLLQPLIRAAVEAGASDGDAEAIRRRLSPLTLAVLNAQPLSHPPWRTTERPDALATAAAVHRILDELDAFSAVHAKRPAEDTRALRAT